MPEEAKETKDEKIEKKMFSQKAEPGQKLLSDISNQINNISRSLKTLEDRYATLRKATQITEQNMLANNKKIFDSIKIINSDIIEIKREMADLKEKLVMFAKELKLNATKEEVGVLRKYIEFWEPLNFVTRNEVNKIIDERLKQ